MLLKKRKGENYAKSLSYDLFLFLPIYLFLFITFKFYLIFTNTYDILII